ncbi:MAG: amino acid ABC transporter permease [Clostridiales bacterium]|nr:amino acid ABC transporter permease [Clostridiales bacterium]
MSRIQFIEWLPTLLEGLGTTLFASLISIITAVLVGALVAIIVAYDNKFLTAICRIYISIFRNTPLLVIMFFFYYGLPMVNISWPALMCGIAAITVNESAFIAEIIRGAIKDIPRGEIEAACSLGLTKFQVVRKVMFPLAFSNAVPMLTGQASVIVKDTSLFSIIMIMDLMRAGNKFYEKYLNSTSILIVALVYVLIFALITQLGRYMEKKTMVRR